MYSNNYFKKQEVSRMDKENALMAVRQIEAAFIKKILLNSFFIMALILTVGLCPHRAMAAGVTVAWDVNTEPDVVSYAVMYGTGSNSYTDVVTVNNPQDNPTHFEQYVEDLTPGVHYYFTVKAVDAAGQMSDAADEASILMPYGFDGSDLAAHMGEIEWLETGTVEAGSDWTTVNLEKSFTNPVVIVSPVSERETDPCTVRVANVTGSSFDLRVQEWDYLDDVHGAEKVSYIVVEAGVYSMPDGTTWQAGTYELSGIRTFSEVNFPAEFNSVPVVFQTVQTENEADAIAVREQNITETGFSSALDEQEALRDGHTVETVGYLAVEKNVDGTHVINTVSATDELFAPSGIEGIYLKLEEEQSRDDETAHTTETIGYMQIGDLMLAQVQTYKGGDTCTMRLMEVTEKSGSDDWYLDEDWIDVGSVDLAADWVTVNLERSFVNPVVIAGPPTRNGSDPCLVKIRNVTADSFEIRLQEWNYNNGGHVTETVSWMVIEAGVHVLPDGTIWEAGLYDMEGTNQWNTIAMSHDFGLTPVILQTVQSDNEEDAVATRLTSINGNSFRSAFQEEEARNDGHGIETVGYLAAPLSSPCQIGIASLNHVFTQVGAGMPAVMVEEEKSRDSETSHVNENIGYLGLDIYFFSQIQTTKGGDTAVLRMQ